MKEYKLKRTKDNYIDKNELHEELTKYKLEYDLCKANGLPLPRPNTYIGKTIISIATRMAYGKSFCRYTYRNDLISDAIENCVRYLHTFRIEPVEGTHTNEGKLVQNSFGWLSLICWRSFLRRIKKENDYLKFQEELINKKDYTEVCNNNGEPIHNIHVKTYLKIDN